MQSKEWYKSKSVWGSVISFAAIVAGAFGYTFGAEDQAALVDTIMQVVAGAGVLLAMYGRLVAKTTIQ